MALVNKGITLGTLGRSEDEIVVYDDVVARSATAPVPARAGGQGARQQGDHARRAWPQRGGSPSTTMWSRASAPRRNWPCASRWPRRSSARGSGSACSAAGGGIAVYDDVVARFGTAPELALREQVARRSSTRGSRSASSAAARRLSPSMTMWSRASARRRSPCASWWPGARQQGRHARRSRPSDARWPSMTRWSPVRHRAGSPCASRWPGTRQQGHHVRRSRPQR